MTYSDKVIRQDMERQQVESAELSAHGGYGKEKRRTPATMERMPYAIDVNASARYNAVI